MAFLVGIHFWIDNRYLLLDLALGRRNRRLKTIRRPSTRKTNLWFIQRRRKLRPQLATGPAHHRIRNKQHTLQMASLVYHYFPPNFLCSFPMVLQRQHYSQTSVQLYWLAKWRPRCHAKINVPHHCFIPLGHRHHQCHKLQNSNGDRNQLLKRTLNCT